MRQCKSSLPVPALQLPAAYRTATQEISLPQSSAGKVTNVLPWPATRALQNFSLLRNQQYLETFICPSQKKKKVFVMLRGICTFDNLLGNCYKSYVFEKNILNFVNHKACLQMQSTAADLVVGLETLLLGQLNRPIV